VADPRRLTQQGKDRKAQLLACAAKLFAERGFAETRVIDIADAAGVAKGLFYWYFDNKEAVIRELVATTRESLRRAQAAEIDPDADPLEQLRQGTEASVRFMVANAEIYSVVRAEGISTPASELFSNGSDIHVADTAAIVRRGIDAGLIRDEDPELLAFGVLGSVAYYNHLERSGRIDLPADELAAFVGRFVVRAVAVDSGVATRSELASSAGAG
jgi:AcrR family transcriptional regulator